MCGNIFIKCFLFSKTKTHFSKNTLQKTNTINFSYLLIEIFYKNKCQFFQVWRQIFYPKNNNNKENNESDHHNEGEVLLCDHSIFYIL
jgi:hypothetical protein